MDILKSADLGAVARTWGEVAKDLPTHAPKFYIALLTAHPEYHKMFPTIANVPASDLPNNAALKTLSINVLTKLGALLGSAGNPDAMAKQLTDLAVDHKKLGIKRSDFDNLGVVLVNFLATTLGGSFSAADKEAWTTAIKGINTIIGASL